ncbi:preprotein translocase subunit YajC [Puteibacter caeruleilacunae]|nr:preprotein translocase subunit YajC [Puteibacter caeruleilacunae]
MDFNPILLQAGAKEPDMLQTFLPLLIIIVIFWFFMIRPQAKKQKELRKFRESLQKGDKVVTTGGIYGKVAEIKDTIIVMQVDEKVRLKVDKSSVLRDMTDATPKK